MPGAVRGAKDMVGVIKDDSTLMQTTQTFTKQGAQPSRK